MEGVSIRNATIDDMGAMVGLLRELFMLERDFQFNAVKQRRGLEMLLNDKDRSAIRIALFNGRVVGMVTAQLGISTAEGGLSARVEDVVVQQQLRGLGIGGALLRRIGEWARQRDCVRMQLLVDSQNSRAIEFYCRCGWRRTSLNCFHYLFDGTEATSMA